VAAVVVVLLNFISAPYGRHARDGWGPRIPARAGWVVMETPAILVMAGLALYGSMATVTIVFLALWQLHYVHRSWVYPFLTRNQGKTMPLSVAVMAVVFNTINGGFNGLYLFWWRPDDYGTEWLSSPCFIAGVALFFIGMAINMRADATLRGLRRDGDGGYQIPRGGMYRFVSCPNYLGEILEWTGWAIATWSPAGLAFALWTAANLLPRAVTHHRWYREEFSDYPTDRKALIPFIL
jgi:protein-S-isoprenylcysteine O-methyltransferase Ste14